MNGMQKLFAQAIAKDIGDYPSTLVAVSQMAKRGKGAVTDFILADVHRMVRGIGPVSFPNLRSVVREAFSVAHGARGNVRMYGTLLSSNGTGSPSSTTTQAAPTTEQVIGGIIGSLVTAGTAIYNQKQLLEFQEDKIKSEAQTAAAQERAALAQIEANRQIAAMRSQQAGMEPGAPSAGLPGWVAPVGIAAALAVGAAIYFKSK
jgi:hypothetical protein